MQPAKDKMPASVTPVVPVPLLHTSMLKLACYIAGVLAGSPLHGARDLRPQASTQATHRSSIEVHLFPAIETR